MIRIAIDTSPTRPPWNYGGVYEYTREMLREFQALVPERRCDCTVFVGADYASLREGLNNSSCFRTEVVRAIEQPRFWRYGGFAMMSRRAKADVAFFPCPEVLPFFTPPYAVMIHDVAYVRTSFFSAFKNWRLFQLTRRIVRGAHAILTNSECSKRDIVRYFDVAPEKIVVTYLSHNHARYNAEAVNDELGRRVAETWKLERPYILHHGTLQPRKNLVRLMEAYNLMLSRNPGTGLDLVLCGTYGWRYEPILEAAARVREPARVVLTGPVSEDELAALVKGAALCVIPSLYEGFCLPMLEAMACGVPTVVANNSCLPEVSGGVLRYFDAESVEQIAATMRAVLESPSEQQRLRDAGLKRAAEFSWERCARQTLEVLRHVGSGS